MQDTSIAAEHPAAALRAAELHEQQRDHQQLEERVDTVPALAHDTSAQACRARRAATSSTGRPPAARDSSRRRSSQSSVGISASNHSTSRMLVAEVDHGSDTATATARQSANLASCARSKRDAIEGVDIAHPRQSSRSGGLKRGHAAPRANIVAGDRYRKACARSPAIGERSASCVPEMQDAGGERAVLAAHAGMQQAHDDIGIFLAPAAVVGVEAVDTVEIGPPDREIAGARAAPGALPQPAQRSERQVAAAPTAD